MPTLQKYFLFHPTRTKRLLYQLQACYLAIVISEYFQEEKHGMRAGINKQGQYALPRHNILQIIINLFTFNTCCASFKNDGPGNGTSANTASPANKTVAYCRSNSCNVLPSNASIFLSLHRRVAKYYCGPSVSALYTVSATTPTS